MRFARSKRWTAGQALAEYGIALGVVGSLVVSAAIFIRFEIFVLWFWGSFRILRALSGG